MFKKILLAIDLNDASGCARATAAAKSLADVGGAEVHVLNVVPDSGMAIVSAALGPEQASRAVRQGHDELIAFVEENLPGVSSSAVHTLQGTIYDQIIHAADRLGVDTIIVGSHRPELKDYLVGPNAAKVVRHATQTVLVVR